MPRNVRNFWVEFSVDGSKSNVATGPVSKDGGFSMTIRQRDNGSIITAAQLWGHVTDDGRIVLEINAPGQSLDQNIEVVTRR